MPALFCGVSGSSNELQHAGCDFRNRANVPVFQNRAQLVHQIPFMLCESLSFDTPGVVTRCPINKLLVCFMHVATFINPVPETHTLPMNQSFDSYLGWDVEEHDAREIQLGTRQPTDDASTENPVPLWPQITTDQFVSLLIWALFLKWWIGGSMEVVVTIEERNIQSQCKGSAQCGCAAARGSDHVDSIFRHALHIPQTTRITGLRELTLISKTTGHRRSRACGGVTLVLGTGLWRKSPLCEIGISRSSVYQMTDSREQARGRRSTVPSGSQHRDGQEELEPTDRNDAPLTTRRCLALATIIPLRKATTGASQPAMHVHGRP